jgi:hypothetical protein
MSKQSVPRTPIPNYGNKHGPTSANSSPAFNSYRLKSITTKIACVTVRLVNFMEKIGKKEYGYFNIVAPVEINPSRAC